jgi:dolichol-phosphate mannosyltransferase
MLPPNGREPDLIGPRTAATPRGCERINVVVPVRDEEGGIRRFHEELKSALEQTGIAWEVWYVDDGSRDQTLHHLIELASIDARIRVLELSRNFGHQLALTAGLDFARGDVMIVLDGDGQHPPSLIPVMLREYQHDYDIVLTRRQDPPGTSRFKRWTSLAFYRVMNWLSATPVEPSASDFRLMSRDAAEALQSMRESHRFIRGMVSWLGYRQKVIDYVARPRFSGRSKYTVRKMLRFAADGIFSFSTKPLKVAVVLGVAFLGLAVVELCHVLFVLLTEGPGRFAPGWPSLMFFLLLIGALELIMLGVLGQYVGFIFQEVKRRPLYLVRRVIGMEVGVGSEPPRPIAEANGES